MSAARRAAAHIVVTGTAGSSATARSFLRAELDGVRFLDGARTDAGRTGDAALDGADMLVFVADADETADEPRTAALAAAARERGILVAAVLAGGDRAGRSPLLAALRDAADMVMIVREPGDVQAVVAALR